MGKPKYLINVSGLPDDTYLCVVNKYMKIKMREMKKNMEKIKDFFERENDNAEEALFWIHEEITLSTKYETMAEIKKHATEEAFDIGICTCFINICKYNGFGFEMQYDIAPYVAGSLRRLGYEEEADYFQKIMDIFPDFTDFTPRYKTQKYCDILNVMEEGSIEEECEEKRLLQFSQEQLKKMSEDYGRTQKDFEKYVEKEWRKDFPLALKKVEDFARRHFEIGIWK